MSPRAHLAPGMCGRRTPANRHGGSCQLVLDVHGVHKVLIRKNGSGTGHASPGRYELTLAGSAAPVCGACRALRRVPFNKVLLIHALLLMTTATARLQGLGVHRVWTTSAAAACAR